MTASLTSGETPIGAADEPQSDVAPGVSRRLRAAIAVVALGWLGFMLVMLLRSSVPDLGPRMRFGRGPAGHLAMATMLGLLVTTVMSLVRRWPLAAVAWYSTIATSILVAVLEVAQIPVPVRAFELDDLVYGVAGGVLGTAVAAGVIGVVGRRIMLHLVAVLGLAGLIVGVSAAIIVDSMALSL